MKLITSKDHLTADQFDNDEFEVDAWVSRRARVWSRAVGWKLNLYKRDGSISRENVPFSFEELGNLPSSLVFFVIGELNKLDSAMLAETIGVPDQNGQIDPNA
jgi:hypothetical protein